MLFVAFYTTLLTKVSKTGMKIGNFLRIDFTGLCMDCVHTDHCSILQLEAVSQVMILKLISMCGCLTFLVLKLMPIFSEYFPCSNV